MFISVAQNLEIMEKLTSLGGSTFLFGYIERKKYQNFFFEILLPPPPGSAEMGGGWGGVAKVNKIFKKYFFIFMCPKWKMNPPREVNFSKISKFWATLVFINPW